MGPLGTPYTPPPPRHPWQRLTSLYPYRCWLSRIPFFLVFLAPVSVVLILNFVAFGLVINQLRIMDSKKLDKSRRITVISRLRGALSVIVLLGLTWSFAFFAIGGAGVVFHYLFAISNSLQGLFIFAFYCLLKKEAQISWMRCVGCDVTGRESRSTSRGAYKSYYTGVFGSLLSLRRLSP